MNTLSSHHHFDPYALLVSARQAASQHVCEWCKQRGQGDVVNVKGWMVLSNHDACRVHASFDETKCVCLDPVHAGDNKNCPVHGRKQ